MFVRLPVTRSDTGEHALFVLELEDLTSDPLGAMGSVEVIPALIAEGMTLDDLIRLNDYRSAIAHGYCTDMMRPGETEHAGAWAMPGDIDPLYGLTEAQRSYILWLHADRTTGRIGGQNDGG